MTEEPKNQTGNNVGLSDKLGAPKPISRNWVFTSLIKDGEYYTMDGLNKVTTSKYSKFTDINGLGIEEQNWISERYFDLDGVIKRLNEIWCA